MVNFGFHHSEESKQKMRLGHLGKKLSPEHRLNLSKNNAKYWLGKKRDPKMVEIVSNKLKGRKLSIERRKEISKSLIGNNWNVGKKMPEETKKKIGLAQKGKVISNETLHKILKRREKSGLEIYFESIINKYNLPYKFVGNGEFIIGRKCPDFINTNGEKIAIEVFVKRHKDKFRGGLDNWKKERIEIFNRYGWKIIFFEQKEINEDNVIKTLMINN